MFDRRTYRDQVLRPLLKDKTRLSALGDARRTIGQADDDESLLHALAQVDAVALLAVPDDASEVDLARHFSHLEGFLSTGSHPVSKQLDQLVAVLKSKVGDDYRKPSFWAQVRLRRAQEVVPEPVSSEPPTRDPEPVSPELAAFVAAIEPDLPWAVASPEQLREAASAYGIEADDTELAAAAAQQNILVCPSLEPPQVIRTVPRRLDPGYRSPVDLLVAHEQPVRPDEIEVVDQLSAVLNGSRRELTLEDAKASWQLVEAAKDPGQAVTRTVLTALCQQCRTTDDLHQQVLAWYFGVADSLRRHGVPPQAALERLTVDGLVDRDARRILASGHSTSTGPDLTTVKELVETGRLRQARQVFEELTEDGEEESSLLEEVVAALHAAEVLKRLTLDEYRQALDQHDYPTAAQSLARAQEIDQEDEELRRLENQLPPAPPTGLQASYSATDNVIHLTWRGPQGDSVRYWVVRAEAGADISPGSTEIARETAEEQATDTDPVVAREMVYAVWAVRGQAFSAAATVTVTALPEPTRVSASVSASDVLLRWYCPEQATAVSVDLYGPDEQHFPRLPRDELLVSGLVLGQTYEIFLTAHYVVQGEPACSESVTVTVVPREAARPVTDLKVAARAGHPAQVEWTAVCGYQIELWALPLERSLPVGSRVKVEQLEALGGQRLTGQQQEQGLLRSQVLGPIAGLRACYPVTWDADEGLVGTAVTIGDGPSATQVEAVRYGSELVVSWVWPDGDYRMSVSWSGLDDQRGERRVGRVDYQRDGGVRIPRADLVTEVVVRTVVTTPGGDLVCSPVTVLLAAVPPRLAYTLRLPHRLLGSREATLGLTSGGFRGVAELVVVMSTGDFMPRQPSDGQQIAQFRVDVTASPTQTVTFPVPKARGYWLRVFAADPRRLTLEDPPTSTLKG